MKKKIDRKDLEGAPWQKAMKSKFERITGSGITLLVNSFVVGVLFWVAMVLAVQYHHYFWALVFFPGIAFLYFLLL